MAAVAGLFSSHKDAGKALDALYDLGLTRGDVEVVSQGDQAVGPELPTDDTSQMAGSIGALPLASGREQAGALIDAMNMGGMESIKEALRYKGIPSDEAEFFAKSIVRGGVLVIADVDPDEAAEVRDLLYGAGGRVAGH
jgi:hypothetical protein